MRFLFYRYGSICEPDMITALKELGCTVDEIALELDQKHINPQKVIQTVTQTLLDGSFDGVISINYYPVLSEICNIFHIRYISQTVDSPVMELYSDTLSNEWNRIFLFDEIQYQTFVDRNPDHIYHLPLAVNTKRLSSVLSESSDLDISHYHSDISFVGSLYTEKCPYDPSQLSSAALKGYLDGIMDAQCKVYGYFFVPELLPDSMVEQFVTAIPDFYIPPERATRDDRMTLALMYLGPKITSMERCQLLTALGDKFKVDLYTRSQNTSLPVRYHDGVQTLTEMPLVFSNSSINLNMTAKSIRSGIPLRVFDILGCGGFLLSNYQKELGDYFAIGEELDTYTCKEELIEKCAYYLEHPSRRREMAHQALERVNQEHTYEIRMTQMLNMAFSN